MSVSTKKRKAVEVLESSDHIQLKIALLERREELSLELEAKQRTTIDLLMKDNDALTKENNSLKKDNGLLERTEELSLELEAQLKTTIDLLMKHNDVLTNENDTLKKDNGALQIDNQAQNDKISYLTSQLHNLTNTLKIANSHYLARRDQYIDALDQKDNIIKQLEDAVIKSRKRRMLSDNMSYI